MSDPMLAAKSFNAAMACYATHFNPEAVSYNRISVFLNETKLYDDKTIHIIYFNLNPPRDSCTI